MNAGRQTVNTLWDLVAHGRLSEARFAQALIDACPQVVSWCSTPGNPDLRTVARRVIAQLPTALHVGIEEMIQRRWLQQQGLPGPWPAELKLVNWPIVDLMPNGFIEEQIFIEFSATLRGPPGAAINLDAPANTVDLSAVSAWDCDASIRVSDRAGAAQAEFVSVSSLVVLPARIRTHEL